MQRERSRKHSTDEELLAFLDGEMPNTQMRAIRTHLKACWKCRSALAELESEAEAISTLLANNTKDGIERSAQAREEFLRWRIVLEGRLRLFFSYQPHSLLRAITDLFFAYS
jgi:anti-sigma factor RsiW